VDTFSKPKKDPGYVQLRRGFLEHIPRLSRNAATLFIGLLISADWKDGTLEMDEKFRAHLGFPLRIFQRAKQELLRKGYIAVVRRGNQHRPTIVQILKFNNEAQTTNGASTAPSERAQAGAQTTAQATNGSSYGLSTLVSNSEISKLEPPKNLKNKEVKKEQHAPPKGTVWGFLGIDPCGPLPFCTFLEGCWSSRNSSDLPSAVIGAALDTWEDTEGAKSRRCARLFQALAELRRKESVAAAKQTPAHRIPTIKDMIPTRRRTERG
jgi:hypothetical protein